MVYFFTFFYSHRALSVSLSSSHLKLKLKLSSLKLTLSNSHLSVYCSRPDSSSTSPPRSTTSPTHQPSQAADQPQTHATDPPQTHLSSADPLQVSCLCLLHMDAWDFWFGHNIKECGIFYLGITSKNVGFLIYDNLLLFWIIGLVILFYEISFCFVLAVLSC